MGLKDHTKFRRQKFEIRINDHDEVRALNMVEEIRHSGFGIDSDFEFRHSDFWGVHAEQMTQIDRDFAAKTAEAISSACFLRWGRVNYRLC
jgi:hypothetical protein